MASDEPMLFPEIELSDNRDAGKKSKQRASFGKCGRVLEMLIEQGKSEQTARRIVGGWLKKVEGNAALINDAVAAAERAQAIDVAGYVYGCLSSRSQAIERQRESVRVIQELLNERT